MMPSRLTADPRAAARASHAVRTQTSEESWLEIDSTLVDDLFGRPLPPPERQLQNLIDWLKAQVGEVDFTAQPLGDRESLAGVVGAANGNSVSQLLKWGAAKGLLEVSADEQSATLTPEAWNTHAINVGPEHMEKAAESKDRIIQGHCPKCGAGRNADIVASYVQRWDDDKDLGIWSIDTFNTLKCRGCDEVYIQKTNLFSENEEYEIDPVTGEAHTVIEPKVTYWPAPASRPRPEWLDELPDETLRDLLDEVYGALDADHRVLAAIGTRTALDRAMELRGATPALGFAEKITELRTAGSINQQEQELLQTLTDAGSAAAHRGWNPGPAKLRTMMDGTEAFLRPLAFGKDVDAMKASLPPRPRRPRRDRTSSDGED